MAEINHENRNSAWMIEPMARLILNLFADQENGLSLKEMLAVEIIGAQGFIRMSDLAGVLGFPLTTASSMVDRLARKQILKRSRFEDERRIVAVSLTPEGQALRERQHTRQNAWIEDRLGHLTEEERGQLLLLLRKAAD
jgi:DNA-binding MarR family transcriptional regulator